MNFFSQLFNVYRSGIGNDTEQLPIDKQIDKLVIPVVKVFSILGMIIGLPECLNEFGPVGGVIMWLILVWTIISVIIFLGSTSTIIKLLREISKK